MKRITLALMLLVGMATVAHAQKLESIVNKFKTAEEVGYIHQNASTGPISAQGISFSDVENWESMVESSHTLILDDCSKKVKKSFIRQIKSLKRDKRYKVVVDMNQEGIMICMVLKMDDEFVEEVIMATIDRSDEEEEEFHCMMVGVKGKIKRTNSEKSEEETPEAASEESEQEPSATTQE